MNKFEWKDEYILGVEDIDVQHQYFLRLINRLSEEIDKSTKRDYKISLINELKAYASFHFISEENFMTQYEYPLLEEHKQHHLKLLDQLSSKGAMLEMHMSREDFDNIINFLVTWFTQHTVKEDRLFAQYLNEKNS